MSTDTTMPASPEPNPDDGFGDQVEQWLADQTRPAAPAEPSPVATHDGSTSASARVRALRAEVAEAHQLLELQGDEAPLLLDTPKVRRRRKQGAEAARLHELANEPALLAWQAARWRRVLTWVACTALVLALAWSTAGVQVFAAEDHPKWSPGWLFAWLVEPFLSLALLTVVAARAFLATRGKPLDDPKLRKIEGLFLGLTLGMNAWPHLPGIAGHFTISGLVLHILGPVVAVAVVTALPIIWRAFADLDHHAPSPAPYAGATPPEYRANTPAPVPAEPSSTGALIDRARVLIQDGTLPPRPSATQLRHALGCGTPNAQKVRDALRGEG
jgi:hypothetical protein